MGVELVDRTVQVPKELNDVGQVLLKLVADIKNKQSATQIASDVLPGLITAIEGAAGLGDAAHDASLPQFAALFAADLYAAIKSPAVVAP